MIKKNLIFLSVISRHKLDHDHTIDWKNVSSLDSDQSYKRMVSKMIHIKRQDNCLNKQSDTERFPEISLPIEKNPLYSHIELPSPLTFFFPFTLYKYCSRAMIFQKICQQ